MSVKHRVVPAAGIAAAAERAEGSSVEDKPDMETAYDHPLYAHPESITLVSRLVRMVRPFFFSFFLTFL